MFEFNWFSLQWSWLKNQFVLTILVVNRTSCGERGVLQTEVLKVPELPDGTQVSLQWWIFVRAGRPVARCIQSWLSIAGSLSRPDRYLTTQIQARGGSWGQHFLMIIFWWRRTFSRPAETIHKQLVTDGGEWIIKPTVDLILITRSDFRNKGKSSDYDKIKLLSTFLFMFSFNISRLYYGSESRPLNRGRAIVSSSRSQDLHSWWFSYLLNEIIQNVNNW